MGRDSAPLLVTRGRSDMGGGYSFEAQTARTRQNGLWTCGCGSIDDERDTKTQSRGREVDMGSSASASIVYGVHLGGIEGDDEGSVVGALTMLGVECEFDTVDSDLETYANAAGLSHIAVGSWDYGERIICARATLDACDWGSLPFDALPEVVPAEVEKLKAIGKTLGREPGWHLVAFYG